MSFAHAIDIPVSDTATVTIVNADTNEGIISGPFPLSLIDNDDSSADWQTSGPRTLPTGTPMSIVWTLTGTGGGFADYLGWYIDDVIISKLE